MWTLFAQEDLTGRLAEQLAPADAGGVSPWWVLLGSVLTGLIGSASAAAVVLMKTRANVAIAKQEADAKIETARAEMDAKIAAAQSAQQLKIDAQAARQRRADLEAALVEWKAIATDLRERDDNQQMQINDLARAKAACEQKSAVQESEIRHLQAALGLPQTPRPGDPPPPAKEG